MERKDLVMLRIFAFFVFALGISYSPNVDAVADTQEVQMIVAVAPGWKSLPGGYRAQVTGFFTATVESETGSASRAVCLIHWREQKTDVTVPKDARGLPKLFFRGKFVGVQQVTDAFAGDCVAMVRSMIPPPVVPRQEENGRQPKDAWSI